MTSHSLWSEILSVTAVAGEKRADCIVTLGAGSITDAAKLTVSVDFLTNFTLSTNTPST